MENLYYKIYCKNLQDIKNRFLNASIKEITAYFNMLLLKDNQFTAVCEDGKFYLITIKQN
jgi:hypothetical protein